MFFGANTHDGLKLSLVYVGSLFTQERLCMQIFPSIQVLLVVIRLISFSLFFSVNKSSSVFVDVSETIFLKN